MNRYVIATGTITHAINGRDILKKNGIKANIERMKYGTEKYGCGYSVVISTNNLSYAENLLRTNNVRILNISKIE